MSEQPSRESASESLPSDSPTDFGSITQFQPQVQCEPNSTGLSGRERIFFGPRKKWTWFLFFTFIAFLTSGWWMLRKPTKEQIGEAGFSAYKAGNYEEALLKLTEAAHKKHAKSQARLGHMYRMGTGVEKNNIEAVSWFRKAAEQADAQGQFRLGGCYYLGEGIEKDPVEGARWLRKAAEQGDDSAQIVLATILVDNSGVPVNEVEAVRWMKKAAKQGNPGGFKFQVEPRLRESVSKERRG